MERAARLIRNAQKASRFLTDEEIARAVWPAAVGKAIASHTVRVKLVRTTLVVEMADALWQRQLLPLSGQILSRLRAVIGADLVTDLAFRAAIPRREPMRAPSRDTSPAAPDDEAESIQDAVLKKVYQLSRKKATA